uniref:Uncharacterized protein n=1 Tax=Lutzomyia longipalpis TaxID=7200 RepID=A0A1B0CUY2_LUTLO
MDDFGAQILKIYDQTAIEYASVQEIYSLKPLDVLCTYFCNNFPVLMIETEYSHFGIWKVDTIIPYFACNSVMDKVRI